MVPKQRVVMYEEEVYLSPLNVLVSPMIKIMCSTTSPQCRPSTRPRFLSRVVSTLAEPRCPTRSSKVDTNTIAEDDLRVNNQSSLSGTGVTDVTHRSPCSRCLNALAAQTFLNSFCVSVELDRGPNLCCRQTLPLACRPITETARASSGRRGVSGRLNQERGAGMPLPKLGPYRSCTGLPRPAAVSGAP